MKAFLIEITAYDPDLPGERLIAIADTSLRPFLAGDPDRPNVYYDARAIDPANLRRAAYADARTHGGSVVNGGEIEIANADGALCRVLDYGLDGRSLRVLWGEAGAPWAAYATLLRGTLDQPTFTFAKRRPARLQLRVRDRQAEMQRPIQTTKYRGNNIGAAGDEGTEEDIAGAPKPLTYGRCLNLTGVPSNTAGLRYQVHDGPIEEASACYDSGVALTKVTGPPASGQWAIDTATGIATLGAKPAGVVTFDVQGDKTGGAYVSSVAGILKRIALTRAGLGAADIDAAAFAALEALAPAPVGVHLASETHIGEVFDALCESIGAYWSFDRAGRLTVGRLEAPAATPVRVFTEADLLELERIPSRDPDGGIPSHRVIVHYARNYTPQSADAVAGSVTDARRAWLAEATRRVTAEDPSVTEKHLLSPQIERETLLVEESDAQAEASRLQALYGVRRDPLRVDLVLDEDTQALALMDTVCLKFPRFGYGNGRHLRVLAIAENTPRRGQVQLDLWG